jgi:tRNA threonylcarbamoyladenosine biosynthesis protein TsaB
MSFILTIETTTDVCSVALSRATQVVATRVAVGSKEHAQQLTLLIQAVLNEANATAKDLDAVAVSAGPGSYTGLRIGTATAKGIAYATGAKLISVPTLQGVAVGAKNTMNTGKTAFCPMLDARRMEVYMAAYDHNLRELCPAEAVIITPETVQNFWERGGITKNGVPQYDKILMVGNGAMKCESILQPLNTLNLSFMNSICLAENLSHFAYQRYMANLFEDIAYYEPNYLKGANITVSKAASAV